MKTTIEKCEDLFESIICLCAEGPECHPRKELMDGIIKEALKGYEVTHAVTQQGDSLDEAMSCGCKPPMYIYGGTHCRKCGQLIPPRR